MKLWIIRLLALAVLAFLPAASASINPAPDGRPNVLFILCDDIRWDALGYAGNPYIRTPNIDRLAHEGEQFRNVFCWFSAYRDLLTLSQAY